MASNGNKHVAADFEKIIHASRDRKKNEALAARIFNKDRRSSTPVSIGNKASGAGSLASRAGVKKPQQGQQGPQRAPNKPRHSTGNIDGEWTHDLHENRNPPRGPRAGLAAPAPNSLAARITDPNAPSSSVPTGPRQQQKQKRRAAQVTQALIRTELQHDRSRGQSNNNQPQRQRVAQQQQPLKSAATAPSSFNKGMQIRGLAGPYVVMAQNFAPGTTAADIESAMTPVGGIVTSCRVLKQSPIVVAELVFESKEGADNAIATFNNQTADGRLLYVYHKVPNVPSAISTGSRSSSRRIDDDAIVDGSWGFDEPMEVEHGSSSGGSGNGRAPPTGPSAGNNNGGLYSDSLVGGRSNRWGRGLNHGR